jgi:hypothetical protein
MSYVANGTLPSGVHGKYAMLLGSGSTLRGVTVTGTARTVGASVSLHAVARKQARTVDSAKSLRFGIEHTTDDRCCAIRLMADPAIPMVPSV